MGLGKTLTMLALIIGSLDNTARLLMQKPEERKGRSTLIITPLSGEFLSLLKRLTCFLTSVTVLLSWVEQIRMYSLLSIRNMGS